MKKKIFKIAALIIIIAIIIYLMASFGDSFKQSEPSVAAVDANIAKEEIGLEQGREFVRQLRVLRGVELDTNFFQNPVFQRLIDYSNPLPSQEVGRGNPFAPIGQ